MFPISSSESLSSLSTQPPFSPDIVEVINGPQFGDACLQHHGQHVDEEAGMASQDHVGILTQLCEPVHGLGHKPLK